MDAASRLTRFALAGGLLLTIAATGCGGSSAHPPDGGVDAGPPLDPSLFDCTSIAADPTAVPARASLIPAACALDPTCRTVQVSAHRGAGGMLGVIAPEDTLAAYRAGIALGVEYVETDPRPTSDGVLVNVHDSSVDRTTTGTGEVESMTLAQVQALTVLTGSMRGDFSCERIPTLLDLLKTCRGRVVVLVDGNKTDRVDLLVKAILDADAIDWAIFDTSSLDKIDAALAIEPRLHFQIRPSSTDEITSQLDHYAAMGRLPVLVEIDPTSRPDGPPLIHQRGTRAFLDVFPQDLEVQGWLSQGKQNFDAYDGVIGDGVDVLQTDRPDLVIAHLKALGLR
jgi:glycerophosphoryl diester phosphodiesterase